MAIADVTKEYVDTLTNNKYATRTTDSANFEALKSMYSNAYLSGDTSRLPDKKFTHALALLVAHHYALDDTQTPDAGGPDTAVGSITTEKVGDLTQVRGGQPYLGAVKGNLLHLLQTRYGTEYVHLMKTFKPAPLVL